MTTTLTSYNAYGKIGRQITNVKIVPDNHFKAWSDDEDATLAAMVAEGESNAAIGDRLGRTSATVAARKHAQRLVLRPTQCPGCGGPLVQAANGRPRRYCSDECRDQVAPYGRVQRQIASAAVAAARPDRVCEADDCDIPLPRERPRLRFCSKRCSGRTHEVKYRARGRRQALQAVKVDGAVRSGGHPGVVADPPVVAADPAQ